MAEQSLKDTLTKFGAVIRNCRQQLGISQEELAHRAGLHRTYITDIERGARNVTIETIIKLSGALEVRPAELFARLEQLELPRDRREQASGQN